MKALKTILIIQVFITSIAPAKASSVSETGEIKCTILDEGNQPALVAIVSLKSTGVDLVEKKQPDLNGICVFKPLNPGLYDIEVTLNGYKTVIEKNISVSANKMSYVNIKLELKAQIYCDTCPEVVITPHYESMAQKTMSSGTSIDALQIKNSASERGSITEMILSVTPGVTATDDGKDLYVRGARRGSTEYIIDGEKVIGSFNVPSLSIQGITVYTGGIPAMYGDLTGGLVVITTKNYISGMREKRRMYENHE